MKRTTGAVLVLSMMSATAAIADDAWMLNDSTAKVTHDCGRQPRVVINAFRDEVTLTGACSRVSVNGRSNKLVIESAAQLAVHGTDNTVDVGTVGAIVVIGAENKVSWKVAAAGKRPRVSQNGSGNRISQTP